jgi:hypothetical protein
MTAPIRSMPELIEALRARRDSLNISHETIDSIAGLQSGYTSKLLAPKPIKNLGPMSFGSLLGALGLAVVVVEDPAAVVRVEKHWQKRKRPMKLLSASIPASIDNEVPTKLQITPELQALVANAAFMKTIARLGGIGRSKRLSPRHRRIIAKRAARARWSKQNERQRNPIP